MEVNSSENFSNSGEIMRQGPHQVAEKSTTIYSADGE